MAVSSARVLPLTKQVYSRWVSPPPSSTSGTAMLHQPSDAPNADESVNDPAATPQSAHKRVRRERFVQAIELLKQALKPGQGESPGR